MFNTKHFQLLKASLAIFMRRKDIFDFPEAVTKFKELYEAEKIAPTHEANQIYLKDLLATPVEADVFAEMQNKADSVHNSKFYMSNMKDTYAGLQVLKFTDEEIMKKLGHGNDDSVRYIDVLWDRAKVYLTKVAEAMSFQQITLEEALIDVAKDVAASNEMYIKKLTTQDIRFFLSYEAKVQMYQHAREKKSLWGHNWVSTPEDNELHKIAVFAVAHQDKVYLQANYGLRDLKLPATTCLSILEQNVELADITKLNTTIGLMPAKIAQMKELVGSMTFAEAADKAFDGSSPISVDQFKQLLSNDNQVQLKLVTPEVAPVAAASVVSTASPSLNYLASITRAAAEIETYEKVSIAAQSSTAGVLKTVAPVILTEQNEVVVKSPVLAMRKSPDLRPNFDMSPESIAVFAQTAIALGTAGAALSIVYACKPRWITVPAGAVYNLVSRMFSSKPKVKQDEFAENQPLIAVTGSDYRRPRLGSGSSSE
jgi:hypothetical protein